MISLTAQNEYFAALLSMVNTGANNHHIDKLYENMIAEYQNNKIELNGNEENQLFTNLKMRFNRFFGERIVRRQLDKFKNDELILKPYPDILELIEKEQKKNEEVKFNSLDREIKNNSLDEEVKDNSLLFIDPALLYFFLNTIEKNFCNNNRKWEGSNIRLAAFCELLYENKYFTVKPSMNKKRPLNFINNFSKSRYGQDILTSLHATKKKERTSHKTNTKDNKPPLRNYFK